MALALNSFFTKRELEKEELASLIYHDIFDYPLTEGELVKWRGGKGLVVSGSPSVGFLNSFYYLEGKEGVVYKRLLKEKLSKVKLRIARKAGHILSFVPWIKTVGITGALAMRSVNEDSDIDLLIVAQKGRLWTTRLTSLILLSLIGFPLRKAKDKRQKDRLCLNMWLDESRLTWPKRERNAYTAHEIAQIIPLLDRDDVYGDFLTRNSWTRDFWPNAIRNQKMAGKKKRGPGLLGRVIERVAFGLQYSYMKDKITKEKVTLHKALFHPHNLSEVVLKSLKT